MPGQTRATQPVRIPWEIYREIRNVSLESGETIQDLVTERLSVSAQLRNQLEDLQKLRQRVETLEENLEREVEQEEEVPWYCPECQQKFDTEKGLKIHNSKVHKD